MDDHIDWTAHLIHTHLDALTERAIEMGGAQIPWYHARPPAALRRMFAEDYQAIAQMLSDGNIQGLREHIERVGTECIGQGAPAASLIAMASLLEDSVRQLIDTEAASPAAAAEATRRVQSITKNIRMILSGLNLRLLTGAGH